MNIKQFALEFWKSWHSHADWDYVRSFLADDYDFDAGLIRSNSAEELIELMKQGNPWKDFVLLDVLAEGNQVSLWYEGTDSVNGVRIRVAEILTVENGKLAKCRAIATPLKPDPHRGIKN